MVTSYIRLQLLFVISLVTGYLILLCLWFLLEDDNRRQAALKDFENVIQVRNQLQESLAVDRTFKLVSDSKIRSLRFICNTWLQNLENQLKSPRQNLRERLRNLGAPVNPTSGVFIAKDQRMFLKIGNNFEQELGAEWSRDFFSAIRHGGQFFKSFISKFYTRELTIQEFESTSGRYEILKIEGQSYYRYYVEISNFKVLLLIKLNSNDDHIILNHFMNAFIGADGRFKRDTQDIFDWAGQIQKRSEANEFGLRFTPVRSGWIDFLTSKWIGHVSFLLLLIFLIGMGGYQIFSLRLELRILALTFLCFIVIVFVLRQQSIKLTRMDSLFDEYENGRALFETASRIEQVYDLKIESIIQNLNQDIPLKQFPLNFLEISVDQSGNATLTHRMDIPLLSHVMTQFMHRWHLTRRKLDPDHLTMQQELDNKLSVDLPEVKGLITQPISKAIEMIKQVDLNRQKYRGLEFSLLGTQFVTIIPGIDAALREKAYLICFRKEELISWAVESEVWNQHKFAIVNLNESKMIFQNFPEKWTDTRLESFLSSRKLPASLRDDRNILWRSLQWEDMMLLYQTSESVEQVNLSQAFVSIGGLGLLLLTIVLLLRGFMRWLDELIQLLNNFRLGGQFEKPQKTFLRHEGFRLTELVMKFLENIQSRPEKELKLAPFLDTLVTGSRSEYLSLTVLELHYAQLNRESFDDLILTVRKQLERYNGFQMEAGIQCLRMVFQTDDSAILIQNAVEVGLVLCKWFEPYEDYQFSIVLRSGQYRISFSSSGDSLPPLLSFNEIDAIRCRFRLQNQNFLIDKNSKIMLESLYDFEQIDDDFYLVQWKDADKVAR